MTLCCLSRCVDGGLVVILHSSAPLSGVDAAAGGRLGRVGSETLTKSRGVPWPPLVGRQMEMIRRHRHGGFWLGILGSFPPIQARTTDGTER